MERTGTMFWILLSVCYGAITLFALFKTHQEQKQKVSSNAFNSLIGYLICTVWPLAVLCMIASRRLGILQSAKTD